MSALRRDPTVQELFDRVLKLEAENVRLRDRVAETEACIKLATQCLNEMIDDGKVESARLYQNLEDLHDLVWPLVHKVFPDYAADQAAIDRIVPPHFGDGGRPKKPPGAA